MTETASKPGTLPEPVLSAAIEKINGDKPVSMKDLLKVLRPDAVSAEASGGKIPAAAVITDDQRKALERLVEVFGKVVPTERRALQPMETHALLEEKAALADISKMVTKRTEGIRTTVYNHLDVEAEAEEDFDPETAPKDKDGHYLRKGEAFGTGDEGEKFTRETREGAPSLDPAALRALADSEDFPDFDHKTFLSMTTQTRVIDEAKIMIALRKNPALVSVIAAASKPGALTSSFNVRKA